MPDDLSAALAEIRQREQAATPGPWAWRGNIDNGDPYLTSLGHRDVPKPDGTVIPDGETEPCQSGSTT